MLQIDEHSTVEEASRDLLEYILSPENWVMLSELKQRPDARPGQNPAYQRRVGNLRICASVDVTASLDTLLRIAFRAPGLTPPKGADHLASFLAPRIPLLPNSEWQVQIDEKNWIHFIRRYTTPSLSA